MAKIKATTSSKLWFVHLHGVGDRLWILGRDARVAADKAIQVSARKYGGAPIGKIKFHGTLDG